MDTINILFIIIVITLTISCLCSVFETKMDYLDNSGKLMLLSILILFVLSKKVKVEDFMDFQPILKGTTERSMGEVGYINDLGFGVTLLVDVQNVDRHLKKDRNANKKHHTPVLATR